jgi:predicted transposase YdaD
MTKVGRLFEEEKLEYAQKYGQEREKETKLGIARRMLSESIDILTIMKVTMLSKSEIIALQNESANT